MLARPLGSTLLSRRRFPAPAGCDTPLQTIMDYICEELRILLKQVCPDLPFRFGKIPKRGAAK